MPQLFALTRQLIGLARELADFLHGFDNASPDFPYRDGGQYGQEAHERRFEESDRLQQFRDCCHPFDREYRNQYFAQDA